MSRPPHGPRAARAGRGAFAAWLACACLARHAAAEPLAPPIGALAPSPAASAPAPAATAAPFAATPGSAHDFADVAQWRRVFDDPARDGWQKPRELVAALRIRPGAWVADLGAGTGYFSRFLDAAVGPRGVVFAVDTEPNLVAHLRARAEEERTRTIVPVLASFDDPRLPPNALDLVLLVDTYHHLDDRRAYLARLGAALKPAGRIAIVDWKQGALPIGPPPAHKLARTQVIDEMRIADWRLVEEPALLPHQYVLVFVRGGR
ncbi:MAG: class I SAM-dependent methyltransferase [Deltaproteobacteria bacterium]|nr:class I SAM-dependent methyltransferase [Deltaproteobacteria bacterium]